MKKLLTSTLALLLMFVAISCKKDDPEPTPDHDNDVPTQPVPYADGVFNPTMKIAQIVGNNETENWTWNNNKLASIESNNAEYEFSYKGDQIGEAIVTGTSDDLGGLIEMHTLYSYNGNQLTKIENKINNLTLASMSLLHNANNKINYSEMEIDPSQLEAYIRELLGNLNPNKDGEDSDSGINFSNPVINSTFNWNGNNMNQMIVDANVDLIFELGNLQEFTNLIGGENLGLLGDLLALINNLPSTTQIPINLGILDTVDYTFDNKNNPYYGLLYYELGATNLVLKGLSQNNILNTYIHGVAKITTHIPIIGDKTFSIPILSQNQSVTYEYNANGFPTKVTNKRGSYSIIYAN